MYFDQKNCDICNQSFLDKPYYQFFALESGWFFNILILEKPTTHATGLVKQLYILQQKKVISTFASFFLKISKRKIPKTIMGGLQMIMHLPTDIWIFCVFVNSYQRLLKTKIWKKFLTKNLGQPNLDIQENLYIRILGFKQNFNFLL